MQLGGMRSSNTKGGKGGFKKLDFLKGSDVPEKGTKATFTSVPREANGGFSDLYVDVRLANKKEYCIGLKKESVLLDQLLDLVGENGDRWKGKSVTLYRAKGKYINAK